MTVTLFDDASTRKTTSELFPGAQTNRNWTPTQELLPA